MWAIVVGRAAEFVLALLSAIKSVAAAIMQWRAIEFGRAEGRAASDAAHAEAARQAEDRMQDIANRPPVREEIIKRLEEGSA